MCSRQPISYSPDLLAAAKDKTYYALTMFPYPSGSGLHCGHASVFTINDVVARYKRMQGYAVLNPFGFDAFGLPTENYAMKQNKPARQVTDENKVKFLEQVQALNMSFDMDRVIDTSTPEYYKRTQWIFLKLYDAGLVYKDTLRVNRCPDCMTVLANDQVVDGKCERCKHEITQKKHPQRFIKITDYADRLIEDLDLIDRPQETKTAQKNWIGRSEGAEIDFDAGYGITITCFTTRPDTIYGVTALVLAPENTLLDSLLSSDKRDEVEEYRQVTLAKTAVQRAKDAKEKTGVESGLTATHPLTGEEISIRYADYVLAGYGSGAVMMVPAHDERDMEFAKKFGIEIKQVIRPDIVEDKSITEYWSKSSVYAIIKNNDGKYLFLSYEHPDTGEEITYSFPGGGIDEGESIQDAMKRELIEETGYSDVDILSMTAIRAKYYGRRKQKHIDNIAYFCEAELSSEKNIGQQLDSIEKKYNLTLHRLSEEDIKKKMGDNHYHTKAFNYLLGKDLIREGTLINSGKFDGMEHEEAKSKIITHLESLGKGRMKVTYKLRDRSISRQRYRGSPIPMYHEIPENRKVPFKRWDSGIWKFDETQSIMKRRTILGVLHDKKADTYAIISWLGLGVENYTFVLGGIDEGEDPIAACKREIGEETGYTNISFVKKLGEFQTEFWHKVKKRNQHNITDAYLFEIDDHTNEGQKLEENENLEVIWMTKDEILGCGQDESLRNHFLRLASGEHVSRDGERIDRYNEYNPIPDEIVHPIPESELPVVLPLDLENYQPTGKSPLEDHPTFPVYEKDGVRYTRECDTLDTFMCSAFYFLRYPDAGNPDELVRKELADKMFPVDFYSGGKEHTVGHLLYSRFIHKFLFDQGYLSSAEPFTKLVHQGMVLGADGRKMGKRYGNGVDPIEVVNKYGADAVRTYMMFMGPVEADKQWNDGALHGVQKFLKKVKNLLTVERRGTQSDVVESLLHETIKGITKDIEALKLNTVVSKYMILLNKINEEKAVTDHQLRTFALLLAPYATDLAEEMWSKLGGEGSVHYAQWPIADESKIQQSMITLPIQINGKVRAKIEIHAGFSEVDVVVLAKEQENVMKYIQEKEIRKVIWVQDKILNIIVG